MYNHELVAQVRQQGESLTDEKNLELYQLVRHGDAVARERMITGNMPLVIDWVDVFIRVSGGRLEFFRDDLTSAGFLGLVGAVNNLAKGGKEIEIPVGYIKRAIYARLFDTIIQTYSIGRPRSGGRARRNVDWVVPTTVPTDMEKLPINTEVTAVDLRDSLEVFCSNDVERRMLQLLEEGYMQDEIAGLVSTNQSTVSRFVYRIEAAIQRECLND